jgi:cell division septum initiation protein DivIVA
MTTELTPEFAHNLRGYNRVQVDDYVDTLRDWLDTTTARLQAAEAEVAQLRGYVGRVQQRVVELEAEAAQAPSRSLRAAGERVARILATAEETATEVVDEARSEADALLARARSDASTMMSRAQPEATELLARARSEADQTLSQAKTHAAEMVTVASLEAVRLTETARAEADEMRKAAEQHRSDAEVALGEANRQAEEIVARAERQSNTTYEEVAAETEARMTRREQEAGQQAAELVGQAETEAAGIRDAARADQQKVLAELAGQRAEAALQIRALEGQRDEVLARLAELRDSLRQTIGQMPPDPAVGGGGRRDEGEPGPSAPADASAGPHGANAVDLRPEPDAYDMLDLGGRPPMSTSSGDLRVGPGREEPAPGP